jgi:hypothetical protein
MRYSKKCTEKVSRFRNNREAGVRPQVSGLRKNRAPRIVERRAFLKIVDST